MKIIINAQEFEVPEAIMVLSAADGSGNVSMTGGEIKNLYRANSAKRHGFELYRIIHTLNAGPIPNDEVVELKDGDRFNLLEL